MIEDEHGEGGELPVLGHLSADKTMIYSQRRFFRRYGESTESSTPPPAALFRIPLATYRPLLVDPDSAKALKPVCLLYLLSALSLKSSLKSGLHEPSFSRTCRNRNDHQVG